MPTPLELHAVCLRFVGGRLRALRSASGSPFIQLAVGLNRRGHELDEGTNAGSLPEVRVDQKPQVVVGRGLQGE